MYRKKEIITVIILIVVMLSLVVLFQFWHNTRPIVQGKTENVVIDIGESSKFSVEEIKAAMDLVIEKFSDYYYCELTELWYNEMQSEKEIIEWYMVSGRGSINGAMQENVIVLHSNFSTGARSGDYGFSPGSRYEDWNWILIRQTKNSPWAIDDWGY